MKILNQRIAFPSGNSLWVFALSILFIVINTYLVTKDIIWLTLLPLFLVIVLLYITALDKIILLIALCTPLAININNFEAGYSISLPTEPLLFGVLLLFILKIIHQNFYDKRILRHPVTIAILVNIAWLLITSFSSQLPLVSFKFLLSRLWFVVPMYFMGVLLFRETKNAKRFIWVYVLALSVVIVLTTIKHFKAGFDEEIGHWIMWPFYNDHTAYGAILAMFIPPMAGFAFGKVLDVKYRAISFVFLTVLMIALYLSYSRAAWISLAGSTVVFILFLLKIRFRWIFLSSVILIFTFITFQQKIFEALEQNKQDASANFIEHLQSISNISTDASNLERINRWQSAIRMFQERPFWGWGPGTYQFIYAPFQRSKEKTIISTNAGDMGNAHSEYIGPLSESGVLGMLTVIAMFITILATGFRVAKNHASPVVRNITLTITLGFVTYFLHGFMNNFLDTDKLSVPFWGFTAIVVAADLFGPKRGDPVNNLTKNAEVQE